VIQAYISDISSPEEKAKRMGMMGAAFGFAFLIGPAIGGILAGYTNIHVVIGLCIVVILINVISIWVILEEPKKHIQLTGIQLQDFHFSKTVITLLFLSF
jgi:MFS transporter, DHA1 family, tetracycline resistance protein